MPFRLSLKKLIRRDPASSLRARAAALSADLARVSHQSAPESVTPVAPVDAIDPVFAVVADYRAAWDALAAAIDATGGEEAPQAEAADSAAYARLRTVRPTTPAGFRALAETWAWRLRAEHGSDAAVEDGEPGSVASHAAASLIAGAGAAATADELVDWYAPPPGFMASPAIEPFGLVRIPDGIAVELDRLRGIALAEFERRAAPEMTPEAEEHLRRELHLDTLSKAERAAPATAPCSADAHAETDPVPALIEAHRTAYAEWDRITKACDGIVAGEAKADEHASGRRERAAYDALFRARPTTLPGVLALAEYLGEAVAKVTTHVGPTDGSRAMATIAASLRAMPQGDNGMADPAASALVAAIEAEWSIWARLDGRQRDEADEQAFDASHQRRDVLLDAAEALPSGTREARHAKALARAWMDWIEDEHPGQPRDAYAFDARLVFDIHASIKSGEQPNVAPKAGPANSNALLSMLDLASTSLDDLQALHDTTDLVSGVAYATCWQGRCRARVWDKQGFPGEQYNAAGRLMHWLGDALTDVGTAANNEARRRTPTDSVDREIRLEMLALPIIKSDDPEATEAFARELLAHVEAERQGR